MQDLEFYWVEPGGSPRVYSTNLVPAVSNNAEWASLGGGVYTPLCLSWIVTNTKTNTSTGHYIKLNLTTHKRAKITLAQTSTCKPPASRSPGTPGRSVKPVSCGCWPARARPGPDRRTPAGSGKSKQPVRR